MSYAEKQIVRMLQAVAIDNPDAIAIIAAIERGDHLNWKPQTAAARKAA